MQTSWIIPTCIFFFCWKSLAPFARRLPDLFIYPQPGCGNGCACTFSSRSWSHKVIFTRGKKKIYSTQVLFSISLNYCETWLQRPSPSRAELGGQVRPGGAAGLGRRLPGGLQHQRPRLLPQRQGRAAADPGGSRRQLQRVRGHFVRLLR